MLEAAGYPDQKGALTAVAKRLKVPATTLCRWIRQKNNPAPADLVIEKRFDLRQAIKDELREALAAAHNARPDATYRDLMVATGILFDKLQLLEDKPTEQHKHTIEVIRGELSTIPPHLSRGAANGSYTTEPIQRDSLREKVGQNDNGHRPGN